MNVLGNPVFLCLVLALGCGAGTTTVTSTETVTSTHVVSTSAVTPSPVSPPGFYDSDCTADAFSPTLTSFSSIWALVNVLIVLIATFFYLVYLCFFKFVDEVVRR
ncbi:ORF53 [Retroperitoneal fibromatosis-associated herpesvirus]|uniref:ORF53 n=1 Tax=Retroperitoneal fibromatosis-associated herpesvirus TaxID=111469 RepID=U5NIF6_9GAMA|nr:ORF53 [Retroperitoneal fibromatosis-associated herpesvirus]AGY30735.1 ORF53 [Retroperitoneal fibromatosis-associated herpesvirus]